MLLISLILICVLFNDTILCANTAGTGSNRKFENIRQRPPLIHNLQQDVSTKIDDTDYWDNDDFVPYKKDRHDTFDWILTKHILLKSPKNTIISPFSIKLVLVLLSEAAGAETLTQHELSSVLPNFQSPALIRDHYKKILGSLKEESPVSELKVGTKIFVDNYIEPRQRYAAILHSYYGTEIENINFSNGHYAVSTINNWCKNITNGYIDNLVNEDTIQDSVMLMLNAIYFNGQWKYAFPKNNTVEQPFFVTRNDQVKAEFMTQTNDFYFFESTKHKAKLIRLRYKGKKFSMTLILPDPDMDLDALISKLDGDELKRFQWLMSESTVKLTLPKIRFDYTSHLKDTLQALGIREIFSQNASLPGLARGSGLNAQLKVSDIIQKSGLIIEENGTVAYAATEVIIANKFGGSYKMNEFNANRPFAFFIEDESTGTLLFAGKITNPGK